MTGRCCRWPHAAPAPTVSAISAPLQPRHEAGAGVPAHRGDRQGGSRRRQPRRRGPGWSSLTTQVSTRRPPSGALEGRQRRGQRAGAAREDHRGVRGDPWPVLLDADPAGRSRFPRQVGGQLRPDPPHPAGARKPTALAGLGPSVQQAARQRNRREPLHSVAHQLPRRQLGQQCLQLGALSSAQQRSAGDAGRGPGGRAPAGVGARPQSGG